MRLAASAVILDTLIDIDPQYPVPTPETKASLLAARAELLAEKD